jgi:hypothetical protein
VPVDNGNQLKEVHHRTVNSSSSDSSEDLISLDSSPPIYENSLPNLVVHYRNIDSHYAELQYQLQNQEDRLYQNLPVDSSTQIEEAFVHHTGDESVQEIPQVPVIEEYLVPVMATAPVLPLGFQSYLNPGSFSGASDSETAFSYLENFETIAESCGWSDDHKLLIVGTCLKDTALSWFKLWKIDNPQGRTWTTFKTALLREFRSPDYLETTEFKLRMRCQGKTEQVQTYIYDVLHLCNKVNATMPEISKIKHLMQGLQPELKEALTLQNPVTLQEFMKRLHLVQKSMRCREAKVAYLMKDTGIEKSSEAELEYLRKKVDLLQIQLQMKENVQHSTIQTLDYDNAVSVNAAEIVKTNKVYNVPRQFPRGPYQLPPRQAQVYPNQNPYPRADEQGYNQRTQLEAVSVPWHMEDVLLPDGRTHCGKCHYTGHTRTACFASGRQANERRAQVRAENERKTFGEYGPPRGGPHFQQTNRGSPLHGQQHMQEEQAQQPVNTRTGFVNATVPNNSLPNLPGSFFFGWIRIRVPLKR